MINVHATGIDTTNGDLVNRFVNNVLLTFDNVNQWGYNVVDSTTVDIYIELGV